VFGIVERLASKGHGKVSETFGAAAQRLRGLVNSDESDSRKILEDGGEVAKDVWKTLSASAGETSALGNWG
jgi:hypothetical protein